MATGNLDRLKEQEIDKKLGRTSKPSSVDEGIKSLTSSDTVKSNLLPKSDPDSRDFLKSFDSINPTPKLENAVVDKRNPPNSQVQTMEGKGSPETNTNLVDYLNSGMSRGDTKEAIPANKLISAMQGTNIASAEEDPTAQSETEQLQQENAALKEEAESAEPLPGTVEEEPQNQGYELDDNEEEANQYGDPEDVENEDPQLGTAAVTQLSSIEQFTSPEQTQAAFNLYGNSPSVQRFFRTSPPDIVMQTGIGKELEKIASSYSIVPDSERSTTTRTQFQQGDGVYIDPVSGKPVSRPGFFKRLGNAIKYALGIGDMYETQPMMGAGGSSMTTSSTSQRMNGGGSAGGMMQPQNMGQSGQQSMMGGGISNFAGNLGQGGYENPYAQLDSIYSQGTPQGNFNPQMPPFNPEMYMGQQQGGMPAISPLLRGSQTGQNNFNFDIPQSPEPFFRSNRPTNPYLPQ